jgi:phage terminase small subunit
MPRVRKPSDLKRYEGMRSHRPLPSDEPIYPNGLPDKPRNMSRAASRHWDELVTEMAVSGVLKRVDRDALRQLCEDEVAFEQAYAGLWSMAAELKAEAKAKGQELPGGEILALLLTSVGTAAMRAVSNLGRSLMYQRREFGLTPLARARIIVGSRERPQEFIDDAVDEPAELLIMPKAN